MASHLSAAPATGPLSVAAENPRYFSDPNGRIVYLTGSHTWNNFRDMGPTDPPPAFDWPGYLDFLAAHHHNFVRLWTWEQTKYSYGGKMTWAAPFPGSAPARAMPSTGTPGSISRSLTTPTSHGSTTVSPKPGNAASTSR
ncbi:MAG: hypothetical protein M5U09_19235 [Gammaproteobacteria bacterium]|nr:hypothetical protein [Gammaproteobacteria bacterium]